MSATVIARYDGWMVRWEPDSRTRLVEAALALYGEKGYDNTTVEEIAERARLSERTFFRYFVDKREVLFWGAQELEALLVRAVDDAPPEARPIDAVISALEHAGALFEGRHDGALQRQRVIEANAQLREREVVKLFTLASSLAGALERRGVDAGSARLAADAGVAVFRVAFDRWIAGSSDVALAMHIRRAFDELRDVTARAER